MYSVTVYVGSPLSRVIARPRTIGTGIDLLANDVRAIPFVGVQTEKTFTFREQQSSVVHWQR